jgi:hypothetical protein
MYIVLFARNPLADLDPAGTSSGPNQNQVPQVAALELGGQLARKAFQWLGASLSDNPTRGRGGAVLCRLGRSSRLTLASGRDAKGSSVGETVSEDLSKSLPERHDRGRGGSC